MSHEPHKAEVRVERCSFPPFEPLTSLFPLAPPGCAERMNGWGSCSQRAFFSFPARSEKGGGSLGLGCVGGVQFLVGGRPAVDDNVVNLTYLCS